jgi:hypothetical protein
VSAAERFSSAGKARVAALRGNAGRRGTGGRPVGRSISARRAARSRRARHTVVLSLRPAALGEARPNAKKAGHCARRPPPSYFDTVSVRASRRPSRSCRPHRATSSRRCTAGF